MRWHIYEKLLEKVANYSPFAGKVWIVFIFIFRLIIVTSVGDTIYDDEQAEFECNTNDPGCKQYCFSQFTPLSQIRFFALQLLLVGTPSMIFIVYALHKITLLPIQDLGDQPPEQTISSEDYARYKRRRRRRKKRRRRERKLRYIQHDYDDVGGRELPRYNDVVVHPETRDQLKTDLLLVKKGKLLRPSKDKLLVSTTTDTTSTDTITSSDEHSSKKKKAGSSKSVEEVESTKKFKTKTVYHADGSDDIYQTRSINRAYFIQAVLRLIFEAVLIWFQHEMYGLDVNWFHDCKGPPCTKVIRCYPSRYIEKTYLLLFMYVFAIISCVLSLFEILSLVYNFVKKRSRRRDEDENGMTDMPLQRVVAQNRRNPENFHRRVVGLNTFPDLGPYPLVRDNQVGGSRNEVIQSNHAGYHY